MAWLRSDEEGIPAGLAEWATHFTSPSEARAACERADWLFWLLSAAADSDHLRRVVVNTGVAAVEFSPALARHAASVAAAHVWSALVPEDRPPRSLGRPLLVAAGIAAVIVVAVDFVVTSHVGAFRSAPNGPWLRSGLLLALWCIAIIVLQPSLERRAQRRLQSDANAMSFATARAQVAAALAHDAHNAHALEKLRAVDARWFRSTRA